MFIKPDKNYKFIESNSIRLGGFGFVPTTNDRKVKVMTFPVDEDTVIPIQGR